MLDKVKPAAIGARRASEFVDDQQVSGPEDNPSQHLQQAIRAELIGSDTCTALGLTCNSSSPVLALCRALIAAGHDPTTRLEAYRGETLCLRVRSIGEAANIEVNGNTRFTFVGARKRRTAPPMRQNRRGRALCRNSAGDALGPIEDLDIIARRS
jgi:hypothetical protein